MDIKNVTTVSKLIGFFLVKADPQGHKSNTRQSDTNIRFKTSH